MLKYLLLATFTVTSFSSAMAQETNIDSEENAVEELPNKKLERLGERISGPITAIGPAGLMLASFDENTDYEISRTEFQQGTNGAFKAADKDKSKTLSLFELEDWREKALGSLDAAPGNFAFDKDFNQRVTQAEFKTTLDFIFTTADTNSDEKILFSELVNVFEMPRRRPIVGQTVDDRLDDLRRQQQAERNRRRR